jgi:hypothetical protein
MLSLPQRIGLHWLAYATAYVRPSVCRHSRHTSASAGSVSCTHVYVCLCARARTRCSRWVGVWWGLLDGRFVERACVRVHVHVRAHGGAHLASLLLVVEITERVRKLPCGFLRHAVVEIHPPVLHAEMRRDWPHSMEHHAYFGPWDRVNARRWCALSKAQALASSLDRNRRRRSPPTEPLHCRWPSPTRNTAHVTSGVNGTRMPCTNRR